MMTKGKNIKLQNTAAKLPADMLFLILACIVIIPVLWLVLSSLKPEKEITSYPPTFIPHAFTMNNFIAVSKLSLIHI